MKLSLQIYKHVNSDLRRLIFIRPFICQMLNRLSSLSLIILSLFTFIGRNDQPRLVFDDHFVGEKPDGAFSGIIRLNEIQFAEKRRSV